MKKKNGFVFIETILVTGILIGSLMILYTLYVATSNTENRKLRYDDPSKIYETYYVYKYLNSYGLESLVNNIQNGSNYEVIYRGRADIFGSDLIKENIFFENLWLELNIQNIYIMPTNISDILACQEDEWTTICTNSNLKTYLKTLDEGEEQEFYFVVEYANTKDGNACTNTECFYYYAYIMITA